MVQVRELTTADALEMTGENERLQVSTTYEVSTLSWSK